MTDPAALFADLRRQFRAAPNAMPRQLHEELRRPGSTAGRIATREWYAVPARIAVERTAHGDFFTPHPNPAAASPRSWALVIPVRCGGLYWGHKNLYELAAISQLSATERASRDVMCGLDIVDLVAVSLDLGRVYGRLIGNTPVLGSPQEPELAGDNYVRVYSKIERWARDWFGGVLMIGDEAENIEWLRRCVGGIVADNLAAGQALQKRLKRVYDGPAVLVAA